MIAALHNFALAPPQSQGEANPLGMFLPMLAMLAIFYFIWFLPMRNKQKKQEELLKSMKAGDRIIVNPGILATVVAVEGDVLVVRVDEKTKIKILRSAVAGMQPSQTEGDAANKEK